MTQRGPLPSNDPVYSEADVAEMRLRWEQAEKERRVENQLSGLVAAFAEFPARMKEIARTVVLEVLAEQRKQKVAEADRRWTRGEQFSVIIQAAIMIFMAYLALYGVSHPLVGK